MYIKKKKKTFCDQKKKKTFWDTSFLPFNGNEKGFSYINDLVKAVGPQHKFSQSSGTHHSYLYKPWVVG